MSAQASLRAGTAARTTRATRPRLRPRGLALAHAAATAAAAVAPIGRSFEQFLAESDTHGWPSFRDEEVVWENTRVLKSSGETVSADGTHLGHNLPDAKGNRYCINLVSVAGRAADGKTEL